MFQSTKEFNNNNSFSNNNSRSNTNMNNNSNNNSSSDNNGRMYDATIAKPISSLTKLERNDFAAGQR